MTDENVQNLPLNESFERVAKVTKERQEFNAQMALPDPLADAVESVLSGFESRKHAESYANQIRAALEARGLEIREKAR